MLTKTHGLIALCQIFVAISVLYLIVGLIKPRWAWLGDRVPNRQVIIGISLLMFMASWTGYSALSLKPKVVEPTAEQAQAASAAVDPEVAKALAESKPATAAAPASAPAPAEPAKAAVAPTPEAKAAPAAPKKAKPEPKAKKAAQPQHQN